MSVIPAYSISKAAAFTSFVQGVEEIAALKQQPGKDIYLMGMLELRQALSMRGWWINFSLLFIR